MTRMNGLPIKMADGCGALIWIDIRRIESHV